mmetsp:Transcript_11185/g.34680  ORF Transcript_11185/g.34680 Transcript_11185/m.34680 type:complete len:213 (+) Transcript_11185:605-1243(+)
MECGAGSEASRGTASAAASSRKTSATAFAGRRVRAPTSGSTTRLAGSALASASSAVTQRTSGRPTGSTLPPSSSSTKTRSPSAACSTPYSSTWRLAAAFHKRDCHACTYMLRKLRGRCDRAPTRSLRPARCMPRSRERSASIHRGSASSALWMASAEPPPSAYNLRACVAFSCSPGRTRRMASAASAQSPRSSAAPTSWVGTAPEPKRCRPK